MILLRYFIRLSWPEIRAVLEPGSIISSLRVFYTKLCGLGNTCYNDATDAYYYNRSTDSYQVCQAVKAGDLARILTRALLPWKTRRTKVYWVTLAIYYVDSTNDSWNFYIVLLGRDSIKQFQRYGQISFHIRTWRLRSSIIYIFQNMHKFILFIYLILSQNTGKKSTYVSVKSLIIPDIITIFYNICFNFIGTFQDFRFNSPTQYIIHKSTARIFNIVVFKPFC